MISANSISLGPLGTILVRAGLLVRKQWLDHGPNRCKLLLKSLKIVPVGLRRRCVKRAYSCHGVSNLAHPWQDPTHTSGFKWGHAKSLRVIGQSLEVAKLPVFELQTDGPNYILSSDALIKIGERVVSFGQ